jgi:DNA-binding MarR family transcriptional regulator
VAQRKLARAGGATGGLEVLADRLHSVTIRLLRQLRRVDVDSGMSGPRLSALSVVVFGGPVTLGQLAAAEQVRPPTMTRLVRALESEGLVRRRSDVLDARVTWVSATARGRRILQEGRQRRVVALAERLKELNAEEREIVTRAATVLESLYGVR